MDLETKATLDELLAGGEPATEHMAPEEQQVPTRAISATRRLTVAAVTKGGRQQLAKQRWKKAARRVAAELPVTATRSRQPSSWNRALDGTFSSAVELCVVGAFYFSSSQPHTAVRPARHMYVPCLRYI